MHFFHFVSAGPLSIKNFLRLDILDLCKVLLKPRSFGALQ